MASQYFGITGRKTRLHWHPRMAWSIVGVIAQFGFMVGWIVPETWQPSGYSWVTNSISDMQAATAPHVWFPIICFAIGGVGSFCFLVFGLMPSLRVTGRIASFEPWVLACAALALGNSFPLIPCQIGPGCSANQQLFSAGGLTDAIVSSIALLVVSLSPIFIWKRLNVIPEWQRFRCVSVTAGRVGLVFFLLLSISSLTGVAQGLTERLLVTSCVLWLSALAITWFLIQLQTGNTD